MKYIREKERIVIACSMLEDEVNAAMTAVGCKLPVVWLERGLHERPQHLRSELQSTIDRYDGINTILLAYGLCGNAMLGIGAKASRLVVPRFDDCIWMDLSRQKGTAPEHDIRSLYFTHGWLQGESALLKQYSDFCNKVDSKKANIVYQYMLKEYQSITMIDTGAYCLEDCREQIMEIERLFGLHAESCKGSTRVLQKLLREEWDEEFCIADPGEKFSVEQFLQ